MTIPIYRLCLHGLYGLNGTRCPRKAVKLRHLLSHPVTHSLTHSLPSLSITCLNSPPLSAASMRQWIRSASVQIIACQRFDANHNHNKCWVIVNWTLRTNFSEILMKIQHLSLTKVHLDISSATWRPSCPGRDKPTGDTIPYWRDSMKAGSTLIKWHTPGLSRLSTNPALYETDSIWHNMNHLCIEMNTFNMSKTHLHTNDFNIIKAIVENNIRSTR